MASVVALSVAFLLGTRLRGGLRAQRWLQVGADLGIVTWLAAYTGGPGSQFVLFYALVAVTGGILARVPGGLVAAAGACVGYLALPALSRPLGTWSGESTGMKPELFVTFLIMTGVLAGVLGQRGHRTADDLPRTTRDLDRVRVDNDVILRHLATGIFTVDEAGIVA